MLPSLSLNNLVYAPPDSALAGGGARKLNRFIGSVNKTIPSWHECPKGTVRYSTVTDLARLRGLSTSVPRANAV
jgi:hypothetical protein